MIVLGIDPGLSATGYAAVELGKGRPKVLGLGIAKSNSRHTLEARLRAIYDQVADVSRQWQPHLAVLEGLYADYAYPRTAILMGHVRGVICLAADQCGAKVLEVSPAEVKQALTGSGRATKDQVERAVTRMLTLKEPPKSDHIYDALALALVGAAREGVDLWRI
jgi:crossover junction endodeoxyribonuclease RuvC